MKISTLLTLFPLLMPASVLADTVLYTDSHHPPTNNDASVTVIYLDGPEQLQTQLFGALSSNPDEAQRQALEYIEVEKGDIALANRLAHEVLGRTLDEMPPQTRRLLVLLNAWVGETAGRQAVKQDEVRFTRREVRTALGLGDTQLKVHLTRLLEMEYLLLYRRGLTYEYSLLWDGADSDQLHLCGLLNVETLPMEAMGNTSRSELATLQAATGRGQVGVRSGGGG